MTSIDASLSAFDLFLVGNNNVANDTGGKIVLDQDEMSKGLAAMQSQKKSDEWGDILDAVAKRSNGSVACLTPGASATMSAFAKANHLSIQAPGAVTPDQKLFARLKTAVAAALPTAVQTDEVPGSPLYPQWSLGGGLIADKQVGAILTAGKWYAVASGQNDKGPTLRLYKVSSPALDALAKEIGAAR